MGPPSSGEDLQVKKQQHISSSVTLFDTAFLPVLKPEELLLGGGAGAMGLSVSENLPGPALLTAATLNS